MRRGSAPCVDDHSWEFLVCRPRVDGVPAPASITAQDAGSVTSSICSCDNSNLGRVSERTLDALIRTEYQNVAWTLGMTSETFTFAPDICCQWTPVPLPE
jgi:hypothetical protein